MVPYAGIPKAEHGSLACASLPHVLASPSSSSSSAPSHFVEHKETSLRLYGGGALEAVESMAPLHSKQSIEQVCFSYIEFDDIAHWLPKLIQICPSMTVSQSCDCHVMHYHLYYVHKSP